MERIRMKPNEDVLNSVKAKLEAEGFPVPAAFKGKLSEEDSLILHVFLDHLYSQVLSNLKQACKELEKYREDKDSDQLAKIHDWVGKLVGSFKEGYDIFANEIEVVPDLATMKSFKKLLEKELQYAMQISLENMAKEQVSELNDNGAK
jgi:hypothetical protein